MSRAFERYIGIDYSGAETCVSSLKELRVYMADLSGEPQEIGPPPSPRRYWTRKAIALWLVDRLSEKPRTVVGIDHGFSFPLKYFERYALPLDWRTFLSDFQRHWPTDEDHTCVDFVRDGVSGSGAARLGDSRWRRITEVRAGAKSVFHFDVPGSVAKSTHAGIPWLLFVRAHTGERVHFWPFDGWQITALKSAIVEAYPALCSHSFPRNGRSSDQQDAYAVTKWLRECDRNGSIEEFFQPSLTDHERKVAEVEGWILGIA
jgi:hypothetical protein